MKNLSIESHLYAPEMTRVFIRGHKLTIKQPFSGWDYAALRKNPKALIRQKFLSPLKKQGHFFTIEKTYNGDNAWLNRTTAGFATYAQALAVLRELKAQAMPGAMFTVKVELVG